MPIVRVNNDGKEIGTRKRAKRVSWIAIGFALAGVAGFMVGNVTNGLFLLLCGNTIASIWNLADDS